jgi:hypothetical protein
MADLELEFRWRVVAFAITGSSGVQGEVHREIGKIREIIVLPDLPVSSIALTESHRFKMSSVRPGA